MNYHIAREGQQLGIFSDIEVQAKLRTGELQISDLCWTEGMANWQTLSSVGLGAFSPPPVQAPIYGQPAPAFNPYTPPSSPVMVAGGYRTTGSSTLASLGQRLLANILNVAVVVALCIPLGVGAALTDKQESAVIGGLVCAAAGIALFGLLAYNIYLLAVRGQSLGKKWVGIKIVNFDTQGDAGFVKAVLLRGIVNGLISSFIPFYGLVDICFIFREDRRCIHDLIAGTTVVQVES